jgi:8-oxo-dGTP pyrophosphatase MutT (NUDIX family)
MRKKTDRGMEIPFDRLPPGFAESLDRVPPEPAEARPAATVVLVREGASSPEVLLLRRHRASGFVPGAYVFPGGRVDPADEDARLHDHVVGFGTQEPPFAYWMAAVRETFEEAGVLLARTQEGGPPPDAHTDASIAAWREALLSDRATLHDVLAGAALRADLTGVVYVAHWVTPVVEPRRFDTRFFLAALPPGQRAEPDPREMSDAQWLAPEHALERFEAGTLPMVFPTVRTLESLCGHTSVAALLAAFGGREIPQILPRLVRGHTGVELVIDPEEM